MKITEFNNEPNLFIPTLLSEVAVSHWVYIFKKDKSTVVQCGSYEDLKNKFLSDIKSGKKKISAYESPERAFHIKLSELLDKKLIVVIMERPDIILYLQSMQYTQSEVFEQLLTKAKEEKLQFSFTKEKHGEWYHYTIRSKSPHAIFRIGQLTGEKI